MHPTTPGRLRRRDHSPGWDATRLRSGAVIAGAAALCVAVPAWAVTGSAVVAVLTALATLTAVAAATFMI